MSLPILLIIVSKLRFVPAGKIRGIVKAAEISLFPGHTQLLSVQLQLSVHGCQGHKSLQLFWQLLLQLLLHLLLQLF